jgi:hypothetical protein
MRGLILLSLVLPFILFSARKAEAQNLGNLKVPLESLGPITSLAEDLQNGNSTSLGKIIDENDCKRTIVLPEDQPPLEAGDMKVARVLVEISGPGCPVAYKMSLDGTQKPDGFQADLVFEYKAISAEAKKLYDVDQMNFNGKLSAGVVQGQSGGKLTFDFVYVGHGNSQSKGSFQSDSNLKGVFEISMAAGTSSGMPFNLKIEGGFEDSLSFDFNSEKATFNSKTVFNGLIPVAEFSINGIKVSEAEYKKVRDLVKLPGMEGVSMGGDEGPQLECTAELFKSSDLSLSSAEQWIRGGGLLPTPVKTSRWCGAVSTDVDRIDSLSYKAEFVPQSTHSTVRLEICDPTSPPSGLCGVAERTFLPDESAKYADDLMGKFTAITACKVVTQCSP